MHFSNYRPISLLPIFSKILEKLMYDRIVSFFTKYNVINKFQFGFRKNHSTFMALITLMDKLRNSLDEGNFAIGIFLDFQKAFDTVNHDILLKKLSNYGIRGIVLEWFHSYLSERTQIVTYNGVKSDCKYISCGVPQGSILGPLLFLVYINDLPSVSNLFLPILFADDTNLFCSGKNLDTLVYKINCELPKIHHWVMANKLSLNVDKTNFMLFAPQKAHRACSNIFIDGHVIQEVDHTKFLGVIIDNKLNWSRHIDYIANKISKGIGIILKARKVFDRDTLLSLYNAMILPYFNYCIHVWGNACEKYMKKLCILQNKIVKIICGVPRRTNCDKLYLDLSILRIKGLYLYSIGLFMYKYANDMLPELFWGEFEPVNQVHDYNTRGASLNQLYVPFHHTTRGQKSFKYVASSTWNFVITHLESDCSIGIFKKHLRSLCKNNCFTQLVFLY